MQETRSRLVIVRPLVETLLADGSSYPWQALAAFKSEKVFSEVTDAALGANYVDTGGDLKVCDGMLQ